MINIFLAYSSGDLAKFEMIVNNLQHLNNACNIWYYSPDSDTITMEEVIKRKLPKTDLFVVFITNNSLNSKHVQLEILEAKNLSKEICPIIIDNSINVELDNRIPDFIKEGISYAFPPINAIWFIEDRLYKIKN